jgi:SAM-dependent methyltransferase
MGPAKTDSPDATRRFSSRVADYVRYRPRYPQALYRFLEGHVGFASGLTVADVGSGTGIFAEPLLEQGMTVHCVEPNPEMRLAAEQLLGHRYANFHSVAAPAEATSLAGGSVDFVTCAQAFHWFDPDRSRAEFRRILKPGGQVVLIWNERRTDATPFLREYERMLLECSHDYAKVRHENVTDEVLRQFFGPGGFRAEVFPNHQHFDFAGLSGRLLSSSYAPMAGQPRHDEMMARLRDLFDRYNSNGRVTFEYDTRLYVGHLS